MKKQTKKDAVKKLMETWEKVENEETKKGVKGVSALSYKKQAEFLIELFDSFEAQINFQVRQGFIDGTDFESRLVIMQFIYYLVYYFEMYDVPDNLDKEVIKILEKEKYVDLLSILNILNYI